MLRKIDIDQKKFILMQVPGHVGIWENKTTVRAAKEALDKKPTDDLMLFSDLKPLIAKYVDQVWQK